MQIMVVIVMKHEHDPLLLSAVLHGADPRDAEHVTPESFYIEQHGAIWQTMIELADRGTTITAESITAHHGAAADLQNLERLQTKDADPAQVHEYAAKVADGALRRLMANIGADINSAAGTDRDVADVYETALGLLEALPKHVAYRDNPPPGFHHDAVKTMYPALDWATMWDEKVEEEWIIYPILPARRMVSIYSPPKQGKSLIMLEIAAAIATGSEVLGTRAPEKHRVLYVDFENDPHQDVITRLKAMGYTPDQLGNLCYLSFPSLPALDSERGSLELMAAIAAYECDVLVVDTVSRAIDGEENDNDTWLNFYRKTGLKLKQAGVTSVRLDHSGKDDTKGQRGGSAKGGDVDAVWRLSTVTKDETYRLECELNRMPVGETTLVVHRETTPVLRHRVDGAGPKAAFDAKVAEIIRHLDQSGQADDIGRDAARDHMKSLGIGASTKALAEAVRQRKNRLGDRLV